MRTLALIELGSAIIRLKGLREHPLCLVQFGKLLLVLGSHIESSLFGKDRHGLLQRGLTFCELRALNESWWGRAGGEKQQDLLIRLR